MSEHTKTPWRLRELINDSYAIYGEGEYDIVFPKRNAGIDADAVFIVTACNCHDELVAALKDLSSWVKKDLRERGIPWCFESVDTALKNAGGK